MGRLAGVFSATVMAVGLSFAAGAASASAQTTWYAYPSGGANSPASCPQTSDVSAQCTLGQALGLAAAGDTVALAVSGDENDRSTLYVGNWTVQTPHTSDDAPLTIEPADGVTNPILDGNNGSDTGCPTGTCSQPILFIGAGVDVTLKGVTVQNSSGPPGVETAGGGIYLRGTLRVDGCTFTHNHADDGGAIYMGYDSISHPATTLTVTNSTFNGNSGGAFGGGAISAAAGGVGASELRAVLTVRGSTFVDNDAGSGGWGLGGAIVSGSGLSTSEGGDATVNISGSTFENNTANLGGAVAAGYGAGGLADSGDTTTITDSTFTGNTAFAGGAILSTWNIGADTLVVNHSTFMSNSARAEGGAIATAGLVGVANPPATVVDSTFVGNGASNGGAITNADNEYVEGDQPGSGGTLNVSGSRFSDNFALSSGGAIVNGINGAAGTLSVDSSTFTNNETEAGGAHAGGAIATGADATNCEDPEAHCSAQLSLATITGSTFAGNRTPGYGGAISNGNSHGHGQLALDRSTFSGNSAHIGGAISNGVTGAGTLGVTGSTLSGDTADSGDEIGNGQSGTGTLTVAGDLFAGSCANAGTWTDRGFNVGADTTCFGSPPRASDTSAGSTLASDLGPLADNGGPTQTMALLAGSPAIGAVPANTTVTVNGSSVPLCPGTDQRGLPRPEAGDTACDAGAFELQLHPTSLSYTGPASGAYGEPVTLTAQLTQSGAGLAGETVRFAFGGESCSGTTDAAGNASCAVSPTDAPGGSPYAITVTFAGDGTYLASSDASHSFTVVKADTITSLASSHNPSVAGETVTYTATVSRAHAGLGSPSGTVAFTDGGAVIAGCGAVALSGGTAKCPVAYAQAGIAHAIVATYSGDANFNASHSGTLSQQVGKAATTLVAAPAQRSGLKITFSATLTRTFDGAPLAGKTIVFTLGGVKVCQAITSSQGIAACTVTGLVVTIGQTTYTASFAGDGSYQPSTATGKL